MTRMCRAAAAVLLIVMLPQFASAQAFSPASLQRAVNTSLEQVPAAPIPHRGRPIRSGMPLLIGAAAGCALGAWFGYSIAEGSRGTLTAQGCAVFGVIGLGVGYAFATR